MQLTHLRPGYEYEVSAPLAEVLIVEGWAEPIAHAAKGQVQRPTASTDAESRRERRSNVFRIGPMQTA